MLNANGFQKLLNIIGNKPLQEIEKLAQKELIRQVDADSKVALRFIQMILRGCLYQWSREATLNDVKGIVHVFHEKLEGVILVGSMVIGPVGVAFGLLETLLYILEGNWKAAGFSLLFCIPGLKQLKCMEKFVKVLKTMPFYTKVEKILNSREAVDKLIAKYSKKLQNNPFGQEGFRELHEIDYYNFNKSVTPKGIDIEEKYQIIKKGNDIVFNSRLGGLTGILGRPQL